MPDADEQPPRAEELIVDIYRQRDEMIRSGLKPDRVIMSRDHYDLIQAYRASLGEMPLGKTDYLDRYRVFDLEICIEEVNGPQVAAGSG